MDDKQVEFMREERVLLVDEADKVIGSASKHDAHLTANEQKGMLHRAFSVFLFNSEGKLLLQQRASEKITFPLQWTNTCCSHPLNCDQEKEEADAMGVKRAAVRKLQHELGINSIAVGDLRFLTRIHYQATCDDSRWSEHEIDHILFAHKAVELKMNANEVASTRYVSEEELKELFAEAKKGAVVITPWFQMICEQFLFDWWKNLKAVLSGEYGNDDSIHRLQITNSI